MYVSYVKERRQGFRHGNINGMLLFYIVFIYFKKKNYSVLEKERLLFFDNSIIENLNFGYFHLKTLKSTHQLKCWTTIYWALDKEWHIWILVFTLLNCNIKINDFFFLFEFKINEIDVISITTNDLNKTKMMCFNIFYFTIFVC